jgi:RNA polymerase sigma-70 factor, ECF subfamily
MDDSIRAFNVPGHGEPGELADHLFRTRAGQMVAYLTRLLGPQHLDIAEEAVQEALLKALLNWPYSGVPQNPAGWLFHVARNAALDAIRHRAMILQKTAQLIADPASAAGSRATGNSQLPLDADFEEQLRDDELRMVLMCCHPALPRDARVALSLKTVGGFSTREIARAFLADEPTIAQRLVRAKRQIRDESIAFELPAGKDLATRLDAALEVIYLMFNEGYGAQAGEDLVRQDLCEEALRLARLVASSSVATPQAHALVALLAFQAARLGARVDSTKELILLEDQDRGAWDHNLIALGFHHFALCAEGTEVSPYHIQAGIAAAHAKARSAAETNWEEILDLYDQLMELSPSPVVALNRAVAVAKVHGPELGLAALSSLAEEHSLRNYYLLPSAEGRLRMETGDVSGAAECFRRALALPCSEPEKRFLQRQLEQCSQAQH